MKMKRDANGFWTISVKGPTRWRTVSLRTKDKAEAMRTVKESGVDQIERAARVSSVAASVVAAATGTGTRTLTGSVDEYLGWCGQIGSKPQTIDAKRLHLRDFVRHTGLGKRPLSSVEPKHVDAYVNDQAKTWKATTRTLKLSLIRAYMKWAAANGMTMRNPAAAARVRLDLLPVEKKEMREVKTFTDEEIVSMIEFMHPRAGFLSDEFWYCATLLGRFAGFRISDICLLHQNSLSSPGVITIWTQKSGRRVEIPIESGPLREAVRHLPLEQGYLWPTKAVEIRMRTVRAKFSVEFKRILEKIGIRGKHFHGLRHTFAHECLRNGTEYPHIAKLMGHINESVTTKHYLKTAIRKQSFIPRGGVSQPASVANGA